MTHTHYEQRQPIYIYLFQGLGLNGHSPKELSSLNLEEVVDTLEIDGSLSGNDLDEDGESVMVGLLVDSTISGLVIALGGSDIFKYSIRLRTACLYSSCR